MRSKERVSAAAAAVGFLDARPRTGLCRRKLVGLTSSECRVLGEGLEISD